MPKLPISVVVPHASSREQWFQRFSWPSIERNNPEQIIRVDDVTPMTKALNQGLAQATQPYVVFVPDNAILAADALEKMLKTLESWPKFTWVYCRYASVDIELSKISESRGQDFDIEALKRGNFMDLCSLIRREECPKFDEGLWVWFDWDLWMTLAKAGKRGMLVPETLFYKFAIDRAPQQFLNEDEVDGKLFLEKWGVTKR